MKQIIFISLIFFLYQLPITHANNCTPVGDPYIGACFAGIERYLARSMSMDALTTSNDKNNNWPIECQNASFACNNPYFDCPHGGYCPSRYFEDIDLLANLNIAFVRRVAHLWGSEYKMKVGNSYYNAASQVVQDINNTYDCAGLRRPIVQAAILEEITQEVNLVPIPSYVIDEFSSDPDFNSTIYQNAPNFNVNNIARRDCNDNSFNNCEETPDLNRVETRMWFYYLATKYIDFGFTALHMGNIRLMIANDVGNIKTYELFNKIRTYANTNNSFVVLDAHTDYDLYFEDSEQLLLDFNSAPVRPIETNINELGSSCINDLKTKIIPEQGDIYKRSSGGISPLGCEYISTPYFVEVDHFEPYCGTIGQNHAGNWCVWGYDEVNYFYNLSDGCKQNFIEYAYPKIRDIDYRGFLQFPGRHGVGSWQIQNDKSWYRLYDYPSLINTVADMLEPADNFEIISNCKLIDLDFGPDFKEYTFSVSNIDNSSIFSWHIKNPDGDWIRHTYGNTKKLLPNQSGIYEIHLRQDNLGLPPQTQGTKTFVMYLDIKSPGDCNGLSCPVSYVKKDNSIVNNASITTSDFIETNQIIPNGSNVTFSSVNQITLSNGFKVESVVNFTAYIEGCSN